MPRSNEEVKAHLMRQAETLIDRLLSEKKPADEIRLSDIERAAVEAGLGFGEAVARQLTQEGQEPVQKPVCPGCGQKMKLKDYRSRRVVTEAGEVEVRRAYYYCLTCRRGVFPPG